MFRLNSKIQIGTLNFTTVVNIEIVSGWDVFTDTAMLRFPTNLRDKNIELLSEIKKGDEVNINLGYYPDMNLHFTGFVSGVSQPQNPMVVKCEDLMWKFKQINVENFSQKGITLDELLTEIIPSTYTYNTVDGDAELGAMRINNATIVEILSKIQKTYGLRSFIDNGELTVGFPYSADGDTHIIYANGEKGTMADNGKGLKFQNSEDIEGVIKATSHKDDNTKIERWGYVVKEGEGDAAVDVTKISSTKKDNVIRTLHFYNITASELEANLENRIPDFIYTGYSGSFTTFLKPKIVHGDKIEIRNPKFPEQDGTYLVKKVTTTFGVGIGGRQMVELDIKVS